MSEASIPEGLCQCGCGAQTSTWKKTDLDRGRIKGQPMRFLPRHNLRRTKDASQKPRYRSVYAPAHPKANSFGSVYEHVLIAETALGHYMPAGAQVHHIDESRNNNIKSNLVICENQAYHMFLHVRAKVVRRGGNPNTHGFCNECEGIKPCEGFYQRRNGGLGYCIECTKELARQWQKGHRDEVNTAKRERSARKREMFPRAEYVEQDLVIIKAKIPRELRQCVAKALRKRGQTITGWRREQIEGLVGQQEDNMIDS